MDNQIAFSLKILRNLLEMQAMQYAIIIPAKNEAENLKVLLKSIANQTLKPVVCLLYDDHSSDNSFEVYKEFKAQYDFFDYAKSTGDIRYQVGAHIARLFNAAVELLHERAYVFDYVVKMDADVFFEPNMFELVSKEIGQKQYGIFSPSPYLMIEGQKKYLYSPLWHTNGQFKIYHIKCFKDIGGLIPSFGWDCADNIRAISKGWETLATRDIEFAMERPIGRYSLYEARRRQGIGAWFLGYDIFYLTLKGLNDLRNKPYFTGTLVYWFYFLKTGLSGKKRILNRAEIKLLRKLFWKSLRQRF